MAMIKIRSILCQSLKNTHSTSNNLMPEQAFLRHHDFDLRVNSIMIPLKVYADLPNSYFATSFWSLFWSLLIKPWITFEIRACFASSKKATDNTLKILKYHWRPVIKRQKANTGKTVQAMYLPIISQSEGSASATLRILKKSWKRKSSSMNKRATMVKRQTTIAAPRKPNCLLTYFGPERG